MYPDYDKIVSKQRISADKENTELHVPAERKVSIMKKRILIVEDDVTIQAQLKTLLTGNGYETAVVTDFSKTIEQVKTLNPHLVLLDIRLPGNSGFEICSQIRAFSDMPIVFVTSSTTDMDELNSIMLGGDAFLSKPYNPAILLAKIAALLRRAYLSCRQSSRGMERKISGTPLSPGESVLFRTNPVQTEHHQQDHVAD